MTALEMAANNAYENEVQARADNKLPADVYAAELAAYENASFYADAYSVDENELRALLKPRGAFVDEEVAR